MGDGLLGFVYFSVVAVPVTPLDRPIVSFAQLRLLNLLRRRDLALCALQTQSCGNHYI